MGSIITRDGWVGDSPKGARGRRGFRPLFRVRRENFIDLQIKLLQLLVPSIPPRYNYHCSLERRLRRADLAAIINIGGFIC